MRARVKPGPRPGWGRVDLPDDGEYLVRAGRVLPAKMARVGRFRTPCLIFPLSNLRVGDEVEVEPVLKCKMCGARSSALINDVCDRCYVFKICGDMVSPPLAAAIYGDRGR